MPIELKESLKFVRGAHVPIIWSFYASQIYLYTLKHINNRYSDSSFFVCVGRWLRFALEKKIVSLVVKTQIRDIFLPFL